MSPKAKNKTPKRLKASIKKDVVNATDWLRIKMLSACEDCTHFKSDSTSCTLGYSTEPHLRETQNRSYLLSGRIAFCRFHEID